MSFDLTFAKPKRRIPEEHVADAYDALVHAGEPGDACDKLPVDDILSALCEAYEDFEPAVKFPIIEEGDGSAEVFHAPYCFSFSFRGDTSDLQERVVGIFRKFGCPVYDPQSGTLYPLDMPFGDPVALDEGRPLPPLKLSAKLEAKMAELRARAAEIERKKRQENRAWYEPVEKLTAAIERDCAGGRWQRLGVIAETCAAVLHNMTLTSRNPAGKPANNNLALVGNINIVFLAYLGAIPPGHEFYDSKAQAQVGVARSLEFCYGAWRNGHKEIPYSKPMRLAQSRKKLGWIKPYREGLVLALYADDETATRRLIEWPDTDLPVDDGLTNLTAGDNQAQIALAFLLRGEPQKKLSKVVDQLRASKRKRAIVFWDAAEAIAANDPRAFATQLRELCNLYRKSAFQHGGFPNVHIDGSILWHVARRSNLALPELAERALDLILR
jgi:hypothetical protein